MPTIDNHQKPVVDEEKIEAARMAEEDQAEAILEKVENGQEQPETDPDKKKTPEKPAVDYEAKFKASQKEALLLKAQLDKVEEEKSKKVEITEEYLQKKYPDWEDMTTGEQKAIKKAEELEQEVQEIKNNANKFNNDREWHQKVETYVTDNLADEFPDIVGREEEFKRFAESKSAKGLPMDLLAKSWLHDNPKPEPKRTSLFHAPGGEGGVTSTDGSLTPDEIRILRTTKPIEYMRLIRAGKIKVKV